MTKLQKLVAALSTRYGEPKLPDAKRPFELVPWENASCLLSDERRLRCSKAGGSRLT